MARKALVLDSNDEVALQVCRALADNGYVVHVVTARERAREFEKLPVYIHLPREDYERLLESIGLEDLEVAIFASPSDEVNLSLARLCKERGVPLVAITARKAAVIAAAEREGIAAVAYHHCVASRLMRVLNLKFSRLTQVKGDVGILEALVTPDSRLLGRKVAEVEGGLGIKLAVVRGDDLVTDPEAELADGDYIVAVGNLAALREIVD